MFKAHYNLPVSRSAARFRVARVAVVNVVDVIVDVVVVVVVDVVGLKRGAINTPTQHMNARAIDVSELQTRKNLEH